MRGMTLTEFLLERINEDEDVAFHGDGCILDLDDAWFSKRRVVAECEAKRRVVEIHRPHDHQGEHGDAVFCDECQWDHGDDSPRIDNQPVDGFGRHPCRTLAALALPYADHPDFDESWRA